MPTSRDGKQFDQNKIVPSFLNRSPLTVSRESFSIALKDINFFSRGSFLKSRSVLLAGADLKIGNIKPGGRFIDLSAVRIPFFPVFRQDSGNSGLYTAEKSVSVKKISDYDLYNVSWGIAIKDPYGSQFRLANDRSAGRNETVQLSFPDVKKPEKLGIFYTEQDLNAQVPTWKIYVPGALSPVISVSSPCITSFSSKTGWDFGETASIPTRESTIQLTRLNETPLANDLEVYVFCVGTLDKSGNQPDIVSSKTIISPGVYSSSSIIWRS